MFNTAEIFEKILPYTERLWIGIVAIAFLFYIYLLYQRRTEQLLAKRHWIETIPNVVSTLGVLGTFAGISLGLYFFDTQDLTTSIPKLLDGLKTAFYTSLAGMFGSLFLSRTVNHFYDEETGGVSDINQAAGLICQAVSELQKASKRQSDLQINHNDQMREIAHQMSESMTQMCTDVGSMAATINSVVLFENAINKAVKETSQNTAGLKDALSNIENATNSMLTSVGNLEERVNQEYEVVSKQLSASLEIDTRLGDIIDNTEAMISTEGEVSEKIENLTRKLHGEVVEIEEKMEETNGLLERKFDEFSELLKKNNTEALVEVMTQVTKEFQSQMNALISKLVQENFAQLNNSVEKLNQWQQENKEMICSLTSQYQQMAENFQQTSTSLHNVKNDTQALVCEGGKLDQLVTSLNEVIVKDEKFLEISNNLQQTANLSKSNMESFDESTRQLNEWVRKQRNFSDAVMVLIKKLEDLNEIRDYAATFWQETRTGMNDAVGIIKNGSESLNNQLARLDQQFYARLSTTLAQLDACIQAIVSNATD